MFEGLKAYRLTDGRVSLFRADRNAHRMATGAARLSIPAIDESLFVQGIAQLVATDADWVPSAPGTALYVRPTIIATEPFLGVRASRTYTFYVITGPVGAYYAGGLKPVRIWVERERVRAVRGGIGAAKAAANYVASLQVAEEARERGCDQVLWLDAIEHEYVEEVGTMNLCLVIDGTLVTPPLGGQHPPRHHPRHRADDRARLGNACRRTSRVDDRGARHACEGHAAGGLRRGDRSRGVGGRDAGQRGGRPRDQRRPARAGGAEALRRDHAVQYGTAPDTHNWLTFCD